MVLRELLAFLLLLVPTAWHAPADEESFRLVHVVVDHRSTPTGGPPPPPALMCAPSQHDVVERSTRTLHLPAARGLVPSGLRALVVVEAPDCGGRFLRWIATSETADEMEIELGRLPTSTLTFREGAAIEVKGAPLPPKGLRITGEGEGWSASATIRDLGAWPAKGIRYH